MFLQLGAKGFVGLPLPITVGVSVSASATKSCNTSGTEGESTTNKDRQTKSVEREITVHNASVDKAVFRKYTLIQNVTTITATVSVDMRRKYTGDTDWTVETVTGTVVHKKGEQDTRLLAEEVTKSDLMTFGTALLNNPLATRAFQAADPQWLSLSTLRPSEVARKMLENKEVRTRSCAGNLIPHSFTYHALRARWRINRTTSPRAR